MSLAKDTLDYLNILLEFEDRLIAGEDLEEFVGERLREDIVDLECDGVAYFEIDCGLCDNIGKYYVDKYMSSWELYSGHITFPIPDPDYMEEDDSAEMARHVYLGCGNMWEGSYGEMRFKFVKFLKECLEEEIYHGG
jgi:hypothetical protein